MLHRLDMLGFMGTWKEQDLRSNTNALNLARMNKVPNIVRRQRKRGNVKRKKFRRNARRPVINVINN